MNKPTIEQLEQILGDDNHPPIHIMPDGSVVTADSDKLPQKTLDLLYALPAKSSY